MTRTNSINFMQSISQWGSQIGYTTGTLVTASGVYAMAKSEDSKLSKMLVLGGLALLALSKLNSDNQRALNQARVDLANAKQVKPGASDQDASALEAKQSELDAVKAELKAVRLAQAESVGQHASALEAARGETEALRSAYESIDSNIRSLAVQIGLQNVGQETSANDLLVSVSGAVLAKIHTVALKRAFQPNAASSRMGSPNGSSTGSRFLNESGESSFAGFHGMGADSTLDSSVGGFEDSAAPSRIGSPNGSGNGSGFLNETGNSSFAGFHGMGGDSTFNSSAGTPPSHSGNGHVDGAAAAAAARSLAEEFE